MNPGDDNIPPSAAQGDWASGYLSHRNQYLEAKREQDLKLAKDKWEMALRANLQTRLLKLASAKKALRFGRSPEWPTIEDYIVIQSAVAHLDPKGAEREKHFPLWRFALAAADKANPKLRLKKTIEEFVKTVDELAIPREGQIPAITFLYSNQPKHPLFATLRGCLFDNQEVTGSMLGQLEIYTSARFKELLSQMRQQGHLATSDAAPLLAWSAILDIQWQHREFMASLRWAWEFASFLKWLEAPDFAPLTERLALLAMMEPFSTVASEHKNAKTLDRVKRGRAKKSASKRNTKAASSADPPSDGGPI